MKKTTAQIPDSIDAEKYPPKPEKYLKSVLKASWTHCGYRLMLCLDFLL